MQITINNTFTVTIQITIKMYYGFTCILSNTCKLKLISEGKYVFVSIMTIVSALLIYLSMQFIYVMK